MNSNLVIQLCLDMIRRCSPYYICLLGECYGSYRPNTSDSLPETYQDLDEDASWLDKNFMVAASSGYDWILRDTFQNSSITELEVTQAVFLGIAHVEQKHNLLMLLIISLAKGLLISMYNNITILIGDSEFCRFYFRNPEHVDGLFIGKCLL